MSELDLIARLTSNLPPHPAIRTGPGDDCAVLHPTSPGLDLLFKTDAVVEGIHFRTDTEPERVGHKALARTLSDLAAMGGIPLAYLVTLGLPERHDPDWAERAYAGMQRLAQRHGCALAGGETTTTPGGILLSISTLGTAPKNGAILRSGAKPGDGIFVSGELGGSSTSHHLDFEPRLAEGQWLASHFRPSSMIDLSDGLAGDLRHILRLSNAGAELLSSAIPIRRDARLNARSESSAKPPLLAALTDGEDFELLFTLPPGSSVALLDGWKAAFPGVKLTCIGKISDEPGLRLRDARGVREAPLHGYVHFQQP